MKRIVFIFSILFIFCVGVSFGCDGNCDRAANESVQKTIAVKNDKGELTASTYICGKKAFIELYGMLSTQDLNFFNDINYLRENTDIRDVTVLITSPGGNPWTAFSIIGQVRLAEKEGFKFKAIAAGQVFSAAVPLFVGFDNREAVWGTAFMIHEPTSTISGSYSQYRSANQLFDLIRREYYGLLIERTNVKDIKQWEEWESAVYWFGVDEAKEMGVIPTTTEEIADECIIDRNVDDDCQRLVDVFQKNRLHSGAIQ